uniref:Uncharacterized protein n=1 Tax=Rhizophora mucronata TaxID=61149 RepID=A0A2P2NRD7_RHIMU
MCYLSYMDSTRSLSLLKRRKPFCRGPIYSSPAILFYHKLIPSQRSEICPFYISSPAVVLSSPMYNLASPT